MRLAQAQQIRGGLVEAQQAALVVQHQQGGAGTLLHRVQQLVELLLFAQRAVEFFIECAQLLIGGFSSSFDASSSSLAASNSSVVMLRASLSCCN